jgi:hypothetical protein
MVGVAPTIQGMAKKKASNRGRPPGRRETVPVYARVDPALAEAWNDYIDTIEPATSGSAMIELLMKQHLRKRGLWPVTEAPTVEDN